MKSAAVGRDCVAAGGEAVVNFLADLLAQQGEDVGRVGVGQVGRRDFGIISPIPCVLAARSSTAARSAASAGSAGGSAGGGGGLEREHQPLGGHHLAV
ncbi:hypothetical protein AB0D16_41015, partial [Streptomyces sp. NPDC048161]|uniref:hypothetical protein n=1 Tax=Streptomyces sp. NPDC048161 TaxID=3160985 RepID=UPI0033C6A34F